MCKRVEPLFGLRSTPANGPIFTFRGHQMSDRYGITHDGYEFKVSQIAGVTVGRYKTEQEAQQNSEACEQDDLILKTSRSLVKKAVNALMRTHHFDRPTAQNWIREAAG